AVLLAAHYDSVPAGPGASDDGVAVAAMLETARALLAGPRPERPVILLIDDGEELGLFGARAFCAEHPWARDVAAVLNFEARGTGGPSLMFETAGGDLDLLRRAASVLSRPMTGSAFAAVYRTMPNDTDLTVFRAHGLAGLNFAFLGGGRRYHTPLDDLAHADPGSMQHHGEQMLALTRALANGPPVDTSPDRCALFFDVLGRRLVVLPFATERLAAGVLVLAFAFACMVRQRSRTLRPRTLFAALAIAPVALAIAWALGYALAAAYATVGRMPTPFPTQPIVPAAGYALCGAAATLAALASFRRRVDAWHLFAAVAGVLTLLGAALAFVLPGTGYPLLVPSVVAVVGMLATRGPGVALGVFEALTAGVLAVMLAPFVAFLGPTIGMRAGTVHAMFAALALVGLVPALHALLGARLPAGVLVCTLAAGLSVPLLLAWPAHDEHHPARANILHCTVAGEEPCWIFEGQAEGASPRQASVRRPLPWQPAALCAAARDVGAPPPEVTIELQQRARNAGTTVRGTLRSQRAAPWLALWLPPGLHVERASIAGIAVDPRGLGSSSTWRSLLFLGAEPDEAVAFELTTRGTTEQRIWAFDRSPGLPPEARSEAQALLRARAAANAAPIHLGDGTVTAVPLPRS
ncbi:MAG TPA: M20/M25/M40 family metallo-hydrolase, partial [Planctomycetota bacterium]|nr:M20/M25/M40 family metallo-hydrolase [Planctomycetota bacterium]